eukprot:PhM_4_TR696/c0_g1_i1/m.56855
MSNALEMMFADDVRVAKHAQDRATRAASGCFDLEQFQAAHPELMGFFSALHLDVKIQKNYYDDDDDDNEDEDEEDFEIFSPYYDSEARAVIVSSRMPTLAKRTATELHAALQHGALMLDQRASHPNADAQTTLIHIILEMCCQHHGNNNGGQNIGDVATRLCRWEDPQPYVDTLRPILQIVAPVTTFLKEAVVGSSTASSSPSLPAAYVPMERLRQQLLRSVVDGHDHFIACVRRAQQSFRRRLKKLYPDHFQNENDDNSMLLSLDPFVRYFDEDSLRDLETCVLRPVEEKESVGFVPDLVRLLQVEAVVSDLEACHGRRTV